MLHKAAGNAAAWGGNMLYRPPPLDMFGIIPCESLRTGYEFTVGRRNSSPYENVTSTTPSFSFERNSRPEPLKYKYRLQRGLRHRSFHSMLFHTFRDFGDCWPAPPPFCRIHRR